MTRMICQGLTGQAWQLTSGGSRQKNFEKVNIIISIWPLVSLITKSKQQPRNYYREVPLAALVESTYRETINTWSALQRRPRQHWWCSLPFCPVLASASWRGCYSVSRYLNSVGEQRTTTLATISCRCSAGQTGEEIYLPPWLPT